MLTNLHCDFFLDSTFKFKKIVFQSFILMEYQSLSMYNLIIQIPSNIEILWRRVIIIEK